MRKKGRVFPREEMTSKIVTKLDGVAYRYAMSHLVYPVLDERDAWFEPMMLQFEVSRDQVLGIKDYLSKNQEFNQSLSFYHLERAGRRSPWGIGLVRSDLIHACRYLFLRGLFDEKFWGELCERGNSPIEADLIILPVDEQ
jgi:antitoxin MazE